VIPPRNKYRGRAAAVPIVFIVAIGVYSIFTGLLGHKDTEMLLVLISGWSLLITVGVLLTYLCVVRNFDHAVEEAAAFERELCERKLRPIHQEP
jgi:hypothetical protein